jgi:hypothetical protein
VPAGQFLSATATDPDGNTSEFAQDVPVTAPPPPVPPPPPTPGPPTSATPLPALSFLPPRRVRRDQFHRVVSFQQWLFFSNPFGQAVHGKFLLTLTSLPCGLPLLRAQSPLSLQATVPGFHQVLLDFGAAGLPPGGVLPLLLTFGRPRKPAFLLLPQLTFLG